MAETDLISREDAIEDAYQWLGKKSSSQEWQELRQRIKNLPSAERTGKWIYKDLDNFRKYEVECSECGAKYIGNYDAYDEPEDFNYCPNCGARMVSE